MCSYMFPAWTSRAPHEDIKGERLGLQRRRGDDKKVGHLRKGAIGRKSSCFCSMYPTFACYCLEINTDCQIRILLVRKTFVSHYSKFSNYKLHADLIIILRSFLKIVYNYFKCITLNQNWSVITCLTRLICVDWE